MIDAQELQPFQDMIRLRCGLVLDGLRQDVLSTAVRRRMEATGASSPSLYFAQVMAAEDEFQELVSLMTINETYFYREPEHLDLLVDHLMPLLLPGRHLPVRILSAGCSTGEEPYSIAIALLERFGEAAAGMVQILAGDIDHHALAKARAARYGAFSFRGLTPELTSRYFRRVGRDDLVVADAARRMVRFFHCNLLDQPFPIELADLDVVFFRNVSIYFDAATRRKIQTTLRQAMSDRGVLITGTAETLANDLGLFHLVEHRGIFHFCRMPAPDGGAKDGRGSPIGACPVSAVPPAPLASAEIARLVPADPPVEPGPEVPMVDRVRGLIRDKRFADALTLLGAVATGNGATLLVLRAYARLMARDFAAADADAAAALAVDEWSVEAMVVRGLAAKWRDRPDQAIRWFRQAVYCRRDCWAAHFYLGELYRAQGHEDPAQRCYRVALQRIGVDPDPDGGLSLPLGLPVAEVSFLCRRHAGQTAGVGEGR